MHLRNERHVAALETMNEVQLLQARLHLVPPFTSRLASVPFDLDWPYWVADEHFDLGYHVREIALPKPGSMAQLAEQTARIYSRRLDRARPLWELYLVHGLEGGRMALVSKVHHAAVDGMSGGEIMTMLYDVTPEPRRIFGFSSVKLRDVKRVKDHFGVKVNDVVVAMVAGGLREHMLAHGILPERPLVAQIPVSVRTDEERGTFGNQVSVMFATIPTNLEDPAERIADTARQMGAAKERHKALPAKALRDVTQFIPPALHARASRSMLELSPRLGINPPYNVVISNVPGPPIDIYCAGARLEALYPLSIITDGAGINVTVMSYRDSIDIGITADREQTPDVQVIADGMAAALADLLAATAPKAAAG
jgi:hypothetical protein